jgi:hypothetical protein
VPVEFQGSLVRIELSGRATAYLAEDGSVWVDGVNPGAFAASGESLAAAEFDLRSTLTEVFLDIAGDSGDLAEFKQQAEDFLHSTDDDTVAEWEAALRRVRKSKGMTVAGLTRRPADEYPPSIRVTSRTLEADTPLLLSDRPVSIKLTAAA